MWRFVGKVNKEMVDETTAAGGMQVGKCIVYGVCVCGCHGERKRRRRRKTNAGFLLSRSAARLLARVQSRTGVEYCDGWETHAREAHVTCSFWTSMQACRKGDGQGRAGGAGVPYVVPIGRYRQQPREQSQTCATTFLTCWVVRSNSRTGCGQARGGTWPCVLNDEAHGTGEQQQQQLPQDPVNKNPEVGPATDPDRV